jgi:2-phosphosulfolactate phosphatase
MRVELEFTAKDANRAVERKDLVIVIDALRSGTSIVHALGNHAKKIIPTLSLKDAYDIHRKHPEYLLAGERRGQKPKGFNLGNSPLEFTEEKVKGKTLVITTTSGTAALINSQKAKWVFVGSFLNAETVARTAEETASKEEGNISFVLAGEKGRFSLEDSLCAGAIMNELTIDGIVMSDSARMALLAYRMAKTDLIDNVLQGQHAKHLMNLGFKQDVIFSCRINIFKIAPVYKYGRITVQG